MSTSFQPHSAKYRLVTRDLTTLWPHIISNILSNSHAMKIQIYSVYHRLDCVCYHSVCYMNSHCVHTIAYTVCMCTLVECLFTR